MNSHHPLSRQNILADQTAPSQFLQPDSSVTHTSQTVWTDHHAAQSHSSTVVPFADSPGTSYLNSAASVVTVERDAAGDDSVGLAVTRAAAVDADADDDDVIGDADDD